MNKELKWMRASEAEPAPILGMLQHLITITSEIKEERKRNIRELRGGRHVTR